eukprot:Awhi_evm1s6282
MPANNKTTISTPNENKTYHDFVKLPSLEESIARPLHPHGDIELLGNYDGVEIYTVMGRFPLPFGPLARFMYLPRTMTIVKEKDNKITLINGMKLTEEGHQALEALGEVKSLIRLGSFHGGDDAYLCHRYPEMKYYVLPGMKVSSGLEKEPVRLTNDTCSIEGGKVMQCPVTEVREGVLWLPIGPGFLVACDLLQNQETSGPYVSYAMGLFLHLNGFCGKGKVGPGFLNFGYTIWGLDPKALLPSFLRELLDMEWDILLSAHGAPLLDAKALTRSTLEQQFEL